jgi:hypothetical protein
MFARWNIRRWAAGALMVAAVWPAAGCGSLNGTGMASLDSVTREKKEVRSEESQRRRFREERDPEAMRWLLGHRVASGMSLADVNQVFGEEGAREYGDRWLKAGNGLYHEGDVRQRRPHRVSGLPRRPAGELRPRRVPEVGSTKSECRKKHKAPKLEGNQAFM